MSSRARNNSAAAADWATKRQEAMDRARRLREERKHGKVDDDCTFQPSMNPKSQEIAARRGPSEHSVGGTYHPRQSPVQPQRPNNSGGWTPQQPSGPPQGRGLSRSRGSSRGSIGEPAGGLHPALAEGHTPRYGEEYGRPGSGRMVKAGRRQGQPAQENFETGARGPPHGSGYPPDNGGYARPVWLDPGQQQQHGRPSHGYSPGGGYGGPGYQQPYGGGPYGQPPMHSGGYSGPSADPHHQPPAHYPHGDPYHSGPPSGAPFQPPPFQRGESLQQMPGGRAAHGYDGGPPGYDSSCAPGNTRRMMRAGSAEAHRPQHGHYPQQQYRQPHHQPPQEQSYPTLSFKGSNGRVYGSSPSPSSGAGGHSPAGGMDVQLSFNPGHSAHRGAGDYPQDRYDRGGMGSAGDMHGRPPSWQGQRGGSGHGSRGGPGPEAGGAGIDPRHLQHYPGGVATRRQRGAHGPPEGAMGGVGQGDTGFVPAHRQPADYAQPGHDHSHPQHACHPDEHSQSHLYHQQDHGQYQQHRPAASVDDNHRDGAARRGHQAGPTRAPAPAPAAMQAPAGPVDVDNQVLPALQAKMGGGGGMGGFGSEFPSEQPDASEAVPRVECSDCGRKFNENVLAKHAKICKKVFLQKRKAFNSQAARVEGTEAAKFVKKSGAGSKDQGSASARLQRGGQAAAKMPAWKARSEQFRAAMRGAAEYTNAVAKGEAPPPRAPSAPDPSLVPCPHCGRSFNEKAADRHIPKCTSIKAKPKMLKRGAGRAAGAAPTASNAPAPAEPEHPSSFGGGFGGGGGGGGGFGEEEEDMQPVRSAGRGRGRGGAVRGRGGRGGRGGGPRRAPAPAPAPQSSDEEDYDDREEDMRRPAQGQRRGQPAPQRSMPAASGLPVDEQPIAPARSTIDVSSLPPEAFAENDPSANMPLIPCPDCGRKFNENVLAKHAKICKKVFLQKRKAFNSQAARVEGTEAAKFVKGAKRGGGGAGRRGGRAPRADERPVRGKQEKGAAWRARSEQFRAAMRANREVSAAEKSGVPMPRIQASAPDPSLIPCPHCNRRFNQKAADRHIPKCNSIIAKPKMLRQGAGVAAGAGGAAGMTTNAATVRRAPLPSKPKPVHHRSIRSSGYGR